MNDLTEKPLCFWIPGICVPKARPRVTRRGTYFPERYKNWRQMAQLEMLSCLSPNIRAALPIKMAEVMIQLVGKHRGDLDNCLGACLDALVSAGILLDDRISCVPKMSIECVKEASIMGVKIIITPIQK